jgi:hypothetical protein
LAWFDAWVSSFGLSFTASGVVFVILLLLAGAVLAWRRRAVGRPLALTAGMFAGGIAASVVVAVAAELIRPGDFWRGHPLVAYLAVYAVMLAAMTAIWARWGGRFGRERARAAAWLLILIVGAALSIALPGATIFFLIAPAVALAGIALGSRILVIGAALVQFLMIAELLALIEMLLIDGPLWAAAPLAALAALPTIIELEADAMRPVAALTGFAAVGLWIAALVVPRATAERPLSFSIDYFRDADRKTASWGVAAKQAPLPDGFPGQWRKGVLPYNGRTRWISSAPLVLTPVPVARVVAAEAHGAGRRIRIQLSRGGGDAIAIRFPEKTKILAMGLPGTAVPIKATGEPAKATLRCAGRSCDGLVVELVLGDRTPVIAELFATRFQLPAQGAGVAAARPRNAVPQYSPDESVTLRRIRL